MTLRGCEGHCFQGGNDTEQLRQSRAYLHLPQGDSAAGLPRKDNLNVNQTKKCLDPDGFGINLLLMC